MRFSIIIPVYNVEKFLRRCLDSAFGQKFSDYEVVAINDGSTDSSMRILENYQIEHPDLKIIHQENKGLGGARNTGIKNAKGDFLVFLDSDDYISANMLKTLDYYLNKYELDILAFDCTLVNENGEVLQVATNKEYTEHYTSLTDKQFFLLEPTACIKTYKRTLYIDHGIYFPEKLWYEDLATVFKLAPYTHKIGYIKESFYFYVQQGTSITHSHNTERMMEIRTALDSNMEYFKKIGLWEKYYPELEWNAILHGIYYSAFRLFGCGYNKKKMKQLCRFVDECYPSWRTNKYLEERMNTRYLMHEVVHRKYFDIYLKTGFCIKYLNPIYTWIQKMKGKWFEHKK